MNALDRFRERLGVPRALIGMLHVGATPGSPAAHHAPDKLVADAVAEARQLKAAGFHALLIENMHDRPYLRAGVGPEVVATLTAVALEVRRATGLPLGVQVLAAANREALAIAHACGATFVRVEGFVFAHVADEGLIQSSAADLLRYRRAIGAERVLVFADIKKKHASHAMTADVTLAETAKAAAFMLADGLIVTGVATGELTLPAEVRAVAQAAPLPVLVGSGLTPANVADYPEAHALIVGSALKRGGVWSNPLDDDAASATVRAFAGSSPA